MTDPRTKPAIKSDQSLFDIINALERLDEPTITEIADHVEMSKSTVYMHLNALEGNGLAAKTSGGYELGLRFLELGMNARDQKELYHAVAPKLDELAAESEEQAWTVIEEHGKAVYLTGSRGKYAVRTDADVGVRHHLHYCSGGKAILAHLPEERVTNVVEQFGLPRRTKYTVTSREALEEELRKIRERGFAINDQESIIGLRAVGAPIADERERVVGAVSVSGAAKRLPVERCETEIANKVLAAANEIELRLIYNR